MSPTVRPAIITVDDDAQVLAAIARDLRGRYGKDYRIVRAESADDALKALTTLKESAEPVALILSDQRMPNLDGVSFLALARELYPTAKRALLTAYADTDAAIAAINRSQVDYYLQKPWDPPDQLLYPVIDDLLDDWRATFRPGYGGVRVIGSRFTPAAHEVKDFLARNHVPYEFFDLETSGERADEARQLADGAAAAAGDTAWWRTAAVAVARRAGTQGRSQHGSAQHRVRRRHRRRRAGWSRGRGVCGIGRPADDPSRS